MSGRVAPKALAFDVFGTVVDWRRGIARELGHFLAEHLPQVDPLRFALDWRRHYQPAMERCRSGERPFVALDELHEDMLRSVLAEHGFTAARLEPGRLRDLAHAWRRLDPWPDVPVGLERLRALCPVVTLSNANVALMVAMNRHNGLRWDAILGAEFARAYKPQPAAYLRTAEALGIAPHELCLVAAHHSDLAAARASGLATAYVDRPDEYGGLPAPDAGQRQAWDWEAAGFVDLAVQLSRADPVTR